MIYMGKRPAHLGRNWDLSTSGDAGVEGTVAFPAVVTGVGGEWEQCWAMEGRTNNDGEVYHVLVQLKRANEVGARRAAVGGDSTVAEAVFRAAAQGRGSGMWNRDMSHYAPVMEGLMKGVQGARAFIRQSGHSLPPGIQAADAAGRRGNREKLAAWCSGSGGVLPLVAGEAGEGGLKAKVRARVKLILKQELQAHAWAGWAAREDVAEQPDVLCNWRILPWLCKQAERMATKRILDGAARAHFNKTGEVCKCPYCGGALDEQIHWLLDCVGLARRREEEWSKVVASVGGWIR